MIHLRGHHLELLYGYMVARKSPFSLKNKKERIINSAVQAGHGKAHGLNIIGVLEKALNQNEKIKIIDTIDDICETCNKKPRKACKEFIQYGISATSGDRGTLYFYGLNKRVYTSKFIQKRLLEKGFF